MLFSRDQLSKQLAKNNLEKETLSNAYTELLQEDPTAITKRHIKILLSEFSPEQIFEMAEKTLQESPEKSSSWKKVRSRLKRFIASLTESEK